MSAPLSFLEAPIPRPLLWIGTPIAALVLIGFFVFMGFPYDRLAGSISQQLSAVTRSQVSISGLEPRITIGGPGFRARDVRVTTDTNQTFLIDPLGLRPAWSTSWLRGRPALQIELDSVFGSADGTLILGPEPAWDGELINLDIAALPYPLPLPAGMSLDGLLNADADLSFTGDVPIGTIKFDATSGYIGHPQLPIELQYESIEGDVVLGGEHLAEIRSLRITGPELTATAEGSVERGKSPGLELLDLQVEVEIKNPPTQAMLRNFGLSLDASGKASFAVGGTATNPKVR